MTAALLELQLVVPPEPAPGSIVLGRGDRAFQRQRVAFTKARWYGLAPGLFVDGVPQTWSWVDLLTANGGSVKVLLDTAPEVDTGVPGVLA